MLANYEVPSQTRRGGIAAGGPRVNVNGISLVPT